MGSWLEYLFRKSRTTLCWLPSKLAAWISDNHGQELDIPPKGSLKWTAGELNVILENNLVPSHGGKDQLRTFCCIQWECERCGRPRARCYPFNLAGHRFRGKNCQVRCFMWYDILYDIVCEIRYHDDILLWAGLCDVTGSLPEQFEPCGFIQRHNQFWLAGGRPGAVLCPQLFFNCTLCPIGVKGPGFSASHKEVSPSWAALGWCPSQRLRGSGASASARAGPGQQRLGSYAARQLLLPALPRVVAERIKVMVMISYLISCVISYHMYIWYHMHI